MKTKKGFSIVVFFLAMIILPAFVHAQKCDSTKLSEIFKMTDFLPRWTKNTSVYNVVPDFQNKKIEIFYGDTKTIIDFDYSGSGNMTRGKDEILNIVISGKENKAYLYVNGIEIKKIIPELVGIDYFQTKVQENKFMIFQFNDGTYGFYDLTTKKFCRSIKIPQS